MFSQIDFQLCFFVHFYRVSQKNALSDNHFCQHSSFTTVSMAIGGNEPSLHWYSRNWNVGKSGCLKVRFWDTLYIFSIRFSNEFISIFPRFDFQRCNSTAGRFISTGWPQVYFIEERTERGKCLHLQEMKNLKIEDRKGGAEAGEARVSWWETQSSFPHLSEIVNTGICFDYNFVTFGVTIIIVIVIITIIAIVNLFAPTRLSISSLSLSKIWGLPEDELLLRIQMV